MTRFRGYGTLPEAEWEDEAMRAEERELAATRLRQIAGEVGLELSPERLERLMGLLESTVDGVRATSELGLEEQVPAFVPDVGEEGEP